MNSRKEHPDPDPGTTGLISIPEAAKEFHRSARSVYAEIEQYDFREDHGVFFRHLDRRDWRINLHLYLYWRRLPVSSAPDARRYENLKLLLRIIDQPWIDLTTMRRQVLAELESVTVLLDTLDPKKSSNHAGDKHR